MRGFAPPIREWGERQAAKAGLRSAETEQRRLGPVAKFPAELTWFLCVGLSFCGR